MKKNFVLCLFVLVTMIVPTGVFATGIDWTKLLGVAGAKTGASSVTHDSNDNIYVAGSTNGNVDGQSATGVNDALLTKYYPTGVRQWTRLLGAVGVSAAATSVTCDLNNNIYVAGTTDGSLDGQPLTGQQDFFVVKYDSSGVKQWTRLLGAAGALTAPHNITYDSNNNVYVTGSTSGDLGGEPLTGLYDLFIVKYDSAGVKQWTKLLGAAGVYSFGRGITHDSNNNIYVTGDINGGVDGQSLTGTTDCLLVKYDSAGVKQWTRLLGVAGATTWGISIVSDPSNNIYVEGSTDGKLDGQTLTGAGDTFLTKYNSVGVKQWTKLLAVPSGYTLPNTIYTCGWGMASDLSSNIYVAGITQGQFSDGTWGSFASFATKYDSNGMNPVTIPLGASWLNTYAYGVTVSANGGVYIAGYTDDNLNGEIKAGINDLFLLKLDYSTAIKEEVSPLPAIKVSPNPFSRETEVTLVNNAAYKRDMSITVYDAAGKKELEKKDITAPANSSLKVKLDLGDMQDGTYFINVDDSKGRSSSVKVIKTR